MIPCRLIGPWISRSLLATVLVIATLLGASPAWAQGEPRRPALAPKLSEAEKDPPLRERDRLRVVVVRLAQAGKLNGAVDAAMKELEFTRTIVGELHEDVISSVQMLAKLHEARADWAAARKALQEVMTIRERQPNRRDWRIADARRALADLDRRAALSPAKRQRLQEAHRLNELAVALHRQGKSADGLNPCRKAMAIRGELLGEDHDDYAQSMNNLATMYQAMGEYAKAEPLLRRAEEISRSVLGEHHPDYASSLNNLASLYQDAGDYAKAEPEFRHAMEILKRAVGENHPLYATSVHNLAVLCRVRGHYAAAEPLFRHALTIWKRVLGENLPDYAASLSGLALLYQDMGDYTKAEPLLRHALEITKRTVGEEHPIYAKSLNNLAMLYQAIGDSAKAEALFCRSLENRKRTLGKNHPDYATSLNNLASLHQHIGDHAKAEPLYREALEIRKRALGEDHPLYAQSLSNLAGLYWAKGEYVKAEPLYQRTLEILRRAVGENHTDYAASLSGLSLLYQDMGDYKKAEPLLRQAVEVWRRAAGENHPDHVTLLNNLAGLYYAKGQLKPAEQALRQGLTLLTKWTQEGLDSVGERQRIRLLSMQDGALSAYLSVAPKAGIKSEDLYRQVLDWKGVVEARQHEDRLARDQPELQETIDQLERARADLARLAFTVPSEGQRLAWRQQFDALRDGKESLESDLARKSGVFRHVQETRRLGAAVVVAALPPGTVLVDLLYYLHSEPPAGGKGPFQREGRLVAFVLQRGKAPVLVPLGASRPVDVAVRDWREALVAAQAREDAGRRPRAEPPHMGAAETSPGKCLDRPGFPRRRPDAISPGGAARAPARHLPARRPGHRLCQLGSPAGRDARRAE